MGYGREQTNYRYVFYMTPLQKNLNYPFNNTVLGTDQMARDLELDWDSWQKIWVLTWTSKNYLWTSLQHGTAD